MFCARSSSGVGAGDPSSRLGSSSSTCSFSTYPLKGELGKGLLGKGSEISGGSTEKSIGELGATTGGSGAATEGICAYVPHLEKDVRQRRKIRRYKSEVARQRSDVPKRQHCGRYEDDERQDHNIDTLFEFHHS